MTRFNRIATAIFAAGALSFAAPALANDVSYPRVVGTGENASMEYGPGPQQNIVGGGAVTVRATSAGNWRITHTEPRFAQQPRAGLRPVTIGSGENAATAWVPMGSNATELAGRFNGA